MIKLDLSSDVGNVERISDTNFFLKSSSGAIKIQLHKVAIDRGMSWDQAFSIFSKSISENRNDRKEGGFYITSNVRLICKLKFWWFRQFDFDLI